MQCPSGICQKVEGCHPGQSEQIRRAQAREASDRWGEWTGTSASRLQKAGCEEQKPWIFPENFQTSLLRIV